MLKIADRAVLSEDPSTLAHGGLGGYQAINFAFLAGAVRIVLLGFDMQHREGRSNWHREGHPVKTPERWNKQFAPNFRKLAKALEGRVEIFNASAQSALTVFARRPIAELLADPA